MTVAELIELLQQEDQDAPVHLAYNCGDHWRTVVAPEVRRVEEATVVHSDYHSMDKLAEDEEHSQLRTVVVLR